MSEAEYFEQFVGDTEPLQLILFSGYNIKAVEEWQQAWEEYTVANPDWWKNQQLIVVSNPCVP